MGFMLIGVTWVLCGSGLRFEARRVKGVCWRWPGLNDSNEEERV
jgi:hypothetical protein